VGFFDWLISDSKTQSPSELAAEAESIRQREADLNLRRLESGYWTQQRYDAAEAKSVADYGNAQVAIASIDDEFAPSALANNLEESASKAGKGVGGFIGSIVQAAGNFVGNTLLGFPVWFWLVAGLGAFFWLGGANVIRAWVAKKSAA
jgi:hypothetical protein